MKSNQPPQPAARNGKAGVSCFCGTSTTTTTLFAPHHYLDNGCHISFATITKFFVDPRRLHATTPQCDHPPSSRPLGLPPLRQCHPPTPSYASRPHPHSFGYRLSPPSRLAPRRCVDRDNVTAGNTAIDYLLHRFHPASTVHTINTHHQGDPSRKLSGL